MASDNHASYARIGFTVFIGVVAIVLTLVYIGGLRGRGNVVFVETYYDKAVNGLSVGSPVNFRGVKVGEVKEIGFVGNHYEVEGEVNSCIYILMALQREAVDMDADCSRQEEIDFFAGIVKRMGLRASVASSGITGLSRIECDFNLGDNVPEPPSISWKPQYAYIPSKISLLDNFSVAATKVMNQINRMDLSAAWSNINASVEALSRAMTMTETVIETRRADIDRLIDDFTATAASMRDFANDLRQNPSLLIRDRKARPLAETE